MLSSTPNLVKTRSECFEEGAILSDTLRPATHKMGCGIGESPALPSQHVIMNNIADISPHNPLLPPLNLCPSSNAGSAMLFDSSMNNNKGGLGNCMGTDSSMATPKSGIPRLSSILGKRVFQ